MPIIMSEEGIGALGIRDSGPTCCGRGAIKEQSSLWHATISFKIHWKSKRQASLPCCNPCELMVSAGEATGPKSTIRLIVCPRTILGPPTLLFLAYQLDVAKTWLQKQIVLEGRSPRYTGLKQPSFLICQPSRLCPTRSLHVQCA